MSIRAAEKRGMLDRSSSHRCDCIVRLGDIFISKIIGLQDFLTYIRSNIRISDATYIKREEETVFGAKKIFNHVNGTYECLQDVLFTTLAYKGLNFIPIFTTALNSKPETVIRKYLERYSIEQTER
ncbi:MAG: hypothetical protein ACXQTO_01160 [Candidatus Syntropharchaeales archaeon]